ncbi:hypothetical protein X736_31835 [Mesorhizobium sp. L2C089B000]|nr:hypothetical protein X736_31835 [Mesorhizobium sp. L2C089B000]
MFGVDLPSKNQKALQQYARIFGLKAATCAYAVVLFSVDPSSPGDHLIEGF